MDIVAITDIYSTVTYVAALIVEAENIAGLNSIQFNMYTVIGLGCSSAVQAMTKLLVNIPDKTRAVETFFGTFSTIEVIISHKLAGKICDILA